MKGNRVVLATLMGLLLVCTALGKGDTVSLQEQIDAATRSGIHQLIIPAGEYVLPKGLAIRDANNFALEGSGDVRILVANTDDSVISIAGSANVRLSNLYLSHLKPRPDYECHGPVLAIEKCANVTVLESELHGCGALGVKAISVAGLVVRWCNIRKNTFNAFYLSRCRTVKVIGNRIEDNANMMAAYEVDDLQMSDNLIQRNGGYWQPKVERPGRMRPLDVPGRPGAPYVRSSKPGHAVPMSGGHAGSKGRASDFDALFESANDFDQRLGGDDVTILLVGPFDRFQRLVALHVPGDSTGMRLRVSPSN